MRMVYYVHTLICHAIFQIRPLHINSTQLEALNCMCIAGVPFYYYSLTLIPARISDHIYHEVWDEITYAFQKFNACTVHRWSLGMDK